MSSKESAGVGIIAFVALFAMVLIAAYPESYTKIIGGLAIVAGILYFWIEMGDDDDGKQAEK